MSNNTKLLLFRRAIFAAAIVALNILQNTRGFFPEPFGVRAFLLIPATVCIGMFEREYAGAFFGLFAGALWDIYTPEGDGYNALVLMVLAVSAGLLIKFLMRNHMLTAFILCIGASLVYAGLYSLFFITARGVGNPLYLLMRFYLPSAGFTSLFTLPFYLGVRALMRITQTNEDY
ncbi:MAG: rod shape-determining protein MreD [Clostridia bacterium]|nr:rod shape-determining protein MreD [Clostridia bacterium]